MTWQLLSSADTNDGRIRWFEARLFRRVRDDDRFEYKVEMVGRSSARGETDRYRTETTTSPHAVVDFLAMGDPGNRYIPKISRKVLHEAADLDSRLGSALDDFDTVVTR